MICVVFINIVYKNIERAVQLYPSISLYGGTWLKLWHSQTCLSTSNLVLLLLSILVFLRKSNILDGSQTLLIPIACCWFSRYR